MIELEHIQFASKQINFNFIENEDRLVQEKNWQLKNITQFYMWRVELYTL